MVAALRWIFLPMACMTAWFVALIFGMILLSGAQMFCPEDQIVSGACTAPWFRTVSNVIFSFSTALSAVLVVATAFFMAPAQRVLVAWLAFMIGGGFALYFALETSTWDFFASAIVAGLITALLLPRLWSSAARQEVDRV